MAAAPVFGDVRLLRQLAANLIDNALRHNLPGGDLSIDVTSDCGRSTFTITNTGPVVPAAQVGRLLQPFQRLSAQRAAGDQGLGLGLAIVAAIARAHQATLDVSPGRRGGLDVRISFPAAAARP
jgi:signal transduction histidine kinase